MYQISGNISYKNLIYKSLIYSISRTYLGNPHAILTNSKWTRRKIRKAYKKDAHVLHPPVNTKIFEKVADSDHDQNNIVTISRFTKIKKIDKIIDITHKLEHYKFIIIGYADDLAYIEYIRRKIYDKRVRNVKLLINAPLEAILEELSKAKYYLHPPIAEHFGISVVEAMAGGLVPIVYRDGGAWTDVVSRVSTELGYYNIIDVPKIVNRIDSNGSWEILSKKAKQLASSFDDKSFLSEFSRVMGRLII